VLGVDVVVEAAVVVVCVDAVVVVVAVVAATLEAEWSTMPVVGASVTELTLSPVGVR
jgi:hypothetical protein